MPVGEVVHRLTTREVIEWAIYWGMDVSEVATPPSPTPRQAVTDADPDALLAAMMKRYPPKAV